MFYFVCTIYFRVTYLGQLCKYQGVKITEKGYSSLKLYRKFEYSGFVWNFKSFSLKIRCVSRTKQDWNLFVKNDDSVINGDDSQLVLKILTRVP